jgi:hypothetical protein
MHFTNVFIKTVVDHLLPSLEPQAFLELTRTNFEEVIAEFYTILHDEHLQIALEMLEMEICS